MHLTSLTTRFWVFICAKIIFVSTFFVAPNTIFAQVFNPPYTHTYELRAAREIPISAGSLLGIGTSVLLHNKNKALNINDLQNISVSNIPRIDRFSALWYHKPANTVSDITGLLALATPLALLADKNINKKEFGNIAVLAFETYAANMALTNLTKNIALRKRPYTYNPNVPEHVRINADARASFFSGHTSGAAAATFFAAKVWNDHHPHSAYKPLVWGSAALLPAVVGYCRIRAGKHFLTDVVTGYAVGAALGILIPQIHNK